MGVIRISRQISRLTIPEQLANLRSRLLRFPDWQNIVLYLRQSWRGFAVALLSVGLVTTLIAVIDSRLTLSNSSQLYLIAVLLTASVFGRGPAIVAATAAFVLFDFFFVDPRYSITVADPEEWLSLLVFLITAIITGQLAADQRRRAEEAQAREKEAVLLYDILRLMQGSDLTTSLQAVASRLRDVFGVETVGIIVRFGATTNPIRVVVGTPAPPSAFELAEGQVQLLQEVPRGVSDTIQPPGYWVSIISPRKGVKRQSRATRYYVPLKVEDRRIGSLVLLNNSRPLQFRGADNRLLLTVAAQLATILEREHLRQQATEAEILRRTDELKTLLLNAVSHDLRTPLASIIAAVESLQQDDISWTEQERRELLQLIADEARRLDQLVSNLLDLSRIQAGKLQLQKQWRDIGTLITDVITRLRSRLTTHQLVVHVPERLPAVPMDELKIAQVLINLLENAAKYSPLGSTIQVSVRQVGQVIEVAVEDEGPGIAPETIPYLFLPFYRVGGDGVRPQGTGLGLVIAKHLVEAHGGRIWAENRPSGGARFVFTLPLAEQQLAHSPREAQP